MVSCLRSGMGVQSALESYLHDSAYSAEIGVRIKALLSGKSSSDPTDNCLSTALQQGVPALDTLNLLKQAKTSRLRAERKLFSLTTQARAQAWIAGLIPLALLLAISFMDPALFYRGMQCSSSLIIALLAFVLDAIGLWWMQRLFAHGLRAANTLQREMEGFLPDFILGMIAKIGTGTDPESAYLHSLRIFPANSQIRKILSEKSHGPSTPIALKQILSLLGRSTEFGAPLKIELTELLMEMENQKESRWEEAAQILPLKILLPVFCCIFPANILVILIPILPEILGA